MHAFQTAASAFCIACICAEITTLLAGAGWAGRCIKAVAGLYILVILFRLAPQMKLELKSAAAAAPAAVSIQSTETSLLQGAQERLEAWYEQQEQREKIETILRMLSLNEKEIFEDYFMCEKSAREIQQANGGTLEGIRAAIRRIRKKARLVEQGKNYFILCILGTLLIIRQIIK